ncbi:MAG: cation transporter [Alicyclobacillus sp.]|nr:cation transporter [Alicyclobacillus sp.]
MELTARKRHRWLQIGLRVQALSVLWTLLEAVLGSIAAGLAGSVALSAFSVDSAVELVSGFVLLVRLGLEYQAGADDASASFVARAERISAAVVAAALLTLAGFIAWRSGAALAARQPVQENLLGLFVAAVAAVVSPLLAVAKRRVGEHLHSHALIGDAACSMTCGYMAWVLLAGLVGQRLFGLWWIDPVAALGILYFILHEAWESAEAAWTGGPHVHHHGGRHADAHHHAAEGHPDDE